VTRLYLQIYSAFVVVVLVSVAFAAVVVVVGFGRPLVPVNERAVSVATRIASLAPDADLDGELDRLAAEVGQELSLYGPGGERIASTRGRVPFGPQGMFAGRSALGLRVALPDGRVLALGGRSDPGRRTVLAVWLALLALGLALGCYPIARRITQRLEQVEQAAHRWGRGALDVRVPVSGRDEIASVATAFNDAAARVEALFTAQRRVLASASHELRAPLSRLRVALELLVDSGAPAETVQRAIRDVEELDRTVGDLLQVGRMHALPRPASPEAVDLLALAAEEGVHVGARVDGVSWVVDGDRRLLRRMLRNLLENAARHGAPPVEVEVAVGRLAVLDRGPGVPIELRESIFEPFFRPAGHDEGRDGGVGLGLHLVREIALHHGGAVHVEPRDGGGSRFVVTLPGAARTEAGPEALR
jgi:signal transduction histidine kinase